MPYSSEPLAELCCQVTAGIHPTEALRDTLFLLELLIFHSTDAQRAKIVCILKLLMQQEASFCQHIQSVWINPGVFNSRILYDVR